MRALLIYQHFGPYHIARLRHLLKTANHQGIEVVALELFGHSDHYQWDIKDHEDNLIQLNLVPDGRDRIQWKDTSKLLKALRLADSQVVFVNGWGMRDAIIVHAWCVFMGARRVLVSDSQEIDKPRSLIGEFVKRIILKGIAAGFVAGNPHKRYLETLGVNGDRVFTGCNAVDVDHFSAACSLRTDQRRRLVTVARWIPTKNLIAAAQAFLAFAKNNDGEPWTWSLAGYGPLESDLQRIAKESEGRIELLGSKSYQQVVDTLANADVYWQPSLEEPWGLAVNEAMAAGLPVLVSNRCGCHEDLVIPGTGWVFDPSSVNHMVEALEKVSQDQELWKKMGDAAKKHISKWGLENYSVGFIASAQSASSLSKTS